MALYFHEDPADADIEMYVDDIPIPGVYRAQEIGGGLTEKYKTEVEHRSGGTDEADAPPAARIEIEAYIREDTWEQLDTLRESRQPFDVQIGPFAFDEMGIRNMEAVTRASETGSTQLNMTLQEFREVVIQERNLFDQGSSSDTENLDAQGPGAAWVDEDGDGRDDNTNQEIPNMETIPLSPGQEWTHNVGSGEAWGRRVLDSSSGNAFPTVSTTGQDWALQDIGVRGQIGSPGRNYTPFGINESGGQSLVRNIYLADGAPMYSGDRGSTGFWINPDTSGNVVFELINVQNFPDNGIYGSPPAGGAQILIKDSYAANNGHANYRLARGEVRNSVSVLDGGGHSANGPRCVWGWSPGPIEINDCDLLATGGDWDAIWSAANGSGTTVNVANSGVEGNLIERNGTINVSNSRSASADNYHSAIPGSPADAAAGVGNSGGGGGSVQ